MCAGVGEDTLPDSDSERSEERRVPPHTRVSDAHTQKQAKQESSQRERERERERER